MTRIHAGDTVLVISGKDKGKTGQVLKVLGDRLVVSDANMRTRHIKKTPQQAGQRIRYEASLSVSNVMIVDAKTKKPSRIGVRVDEKGHKVRFAKVSGELVVSGKVATKKSAVKAGAPAKAEEAPTKKQAAGPQKKAFWKNLSFGADAVQGEIGDSKARPADNSVPPQTLKPDSFSHGRGS